MIIPHLIFFSFFFLHSLASCFPNTPTSFNSLLCHVLGFWVFPHMSFMGTIPPSCLSADFWVTLTSSNVTSSLKPSQTFRAWTWCSLQFPVLFSKMAVRALFGSCFFVYLHLLINTGFGSRHWLYLDYWWTSNSYHNV